MFEKYSEYKDSAVDWIGHIPAHWKVVPGFTIVQERKEKNIKLREKVVLSLSYGSVIVKSEEKLTGLVPESFETYQLVYPGDIIIRPTDLQNDKTSLRTGLAKDNGIITSAYINLRVEKGYSVKFYHYFLHSVDISKVIYSLGSGLRQNLDFGDFKRFKFLVPGLVEQNTIANFLDRKTAQIDQAISIKEKQIELLKERRQILIHNAVTRGLDPDVKMKDSGVEWIGEIPEHWKKIKMKTISKFIYDGTHGSYPRVEKGYRLLSVRNIIDDEFVFREDDSLVSEKHFKEISSKFIIQEGDIQLAIVGATLGKVAIVRNFGELFVTQRSVATIRVDRTRCTSEFLFYFMKSNSFQSYLWQSAGFSAQPGVYLGTIQNSFIPLPTVGEQIQIVKHLKRCSQSIANAISLKQKEIEKLKEYKSTLINSAVTGKIKVA
ncbi:hypothetical protein DYBT9623_04474 [Dyadobacter sp. CECT 9623]|uniref:Type I restriction modification DNA specificity domain-containing protein n=1 Tax=Dyadobacter linearis TaxID=2823330 RepID=A0ABM8UVT9_9BACT|nr:restriction endonuclease subunit S [Dyadobacter sp. CECT 9623]CAG5072938.1 hypothetical protein DYBT9623_04474 [Dyadobacter sp. CECT 9623]